MIIEQTVDGIYIDDLVLRKRQDRYEKTRRRVASFYNNKNISDREIIEHLTKEIEQYRDEIRKQGISNYKYKENTCPEIELGLHPSG